MRVRHRTGAERTLRTAIAAGATPQWLAATTLTAVTDRYFADGGHALDFLNKAFEGIDLVGWQRADAVLPAIVPVLTASLGSEEIGQLAPSGRSRRAHRGARSASLPDALAAGRPRRGGFRDHAALGRAVLGEDPEAIFAALLAAVRDGAAPADVARAVAFAAALRIAHFATSNDHADWDSAHHTFSYANAAFGLLTRATEGGADLETEALCLRAAHPWRARGLSRPLPQRPARPPAARRDDAPGLAPAELRRAFLDACDRQQQVAEAARLAACHLAAGHPPADLIALLGHALLREDAGFHMVQNLAGGRAAVPGLAGRSGGGADPHRRGALSRCPFADAAGAPSDRAGRTAPDAGWGGV